MRKKKPARRRRLLLWICCLGMLAGAGYWVLFSWNRFSLEIRLNGKALELVEYGEIYQEPGGQVVLRGTHFFRDGLVLEDVQLHRGALPDTLGKHPVSYQASFLGLQAQATRMVGIVDTQCPEIILTPEQEPPEPGKPYQEPGFQAVDNVDGDITHKVIRKVSPGKVTYTVVDSSGNPATVERIIPIQDIMPPEIFLVGGKSYTIPAGTVYQEPGFQVVDNLDGDITQQLTPVGEVVWWKPGVYPVTYEITDSSGNVGKLVRKVTVTKADWIKPVMPEGKVIYLTFDDGPGPYTRQLLDILDRYGAKATFFVTNSGYDGVMQEIVRRGHSIGIHTATHIYSQVYASPEAYFEDLHTMQQAIWEATGVRTTLLRFPGGSSNQVSKKTCKGIMTLLTQAVQDAGFQYFDWNVDSGDAGSARDPETVYENFVEGVSHQRVSLVLHHDIQPHTVEAMDQILAWGKEQGYTFLALQPDSPGFHHTVHN